MTHKKFRIEQLRDVAGQNGQMWMLTYPTGFSLLTGMICANFDEAVHQFIAAELKLCPMCGKGSVVHVSWGWICEDCGANDVATGQMKPPPHPVSRAERHGTICEDYELHGCRVDGCPAACFHAIRSPQCCGGGPQWGHAWECPSLP